MRLTPDLLLRAYALGVFPMAENRQAEELHWVDPDLRGVLPLESVHLPRRLHRRLRGNGFLVTCNQDFPAVIQACAAPMENRPETWINSTIEQLYSELHRMGFAHSIEVWLPETPTDPSDAALTKESNDAPAAHGRRLVGGLYGVGLGAAFFGESMFTRVTDASKVALMHLIMRLRQGGFQLLDTQFTTPHLRQFGAIDLPRAHYKALLGRALRETAVFPVELSEEAFAEQLAALRRPSAKPKCE
ncbi:leucyl/phenylalanyl-tRNA--protein transferase [Aquibaculum arenosum]|uniref:Leucyl/phenylalanyl-tRNA--protein transferase n=1 Tax=Aquibaculum arenosum TaxID=3032591 RepID=A0ABT5YLT8_9PROT|nr:leucyl/phenylalanyl-tRNA--protein transferase [Fodinicurvata sp. CAU 1616]MDF2095801.1 leucyl/phenylalanyl-tRNA--protein transferase [Fodinicurvata sp. CAU 1616]